ncbi:hypothetical protein [Cellulosimicrobium sp. TH-20]|uniref:hypothetical protein n=1 Tax=Cellulosimicrobium sp. TH-20 TaxID=1980001 RepID=UPI0011A0FE3F|nr:hypothetical protein [Cellulosimicrobium sp. TH-20]
MSTYERGTRVIIDNEREGVVLAGPDPDRDYVVAERVDANAEHFTSGWDVDYVQASRLAPAARPLAVGDLVRVVRSAYPSQHLRAGAIGRVLEVKDGVAGRFAGLEVLLPDGSTSRPSSTLGWNYLLGDLHRLPAKGERVTVSGWSATWDGPAKVREVRLPDSLFGLGFTVDTASGLSGFFQAEHIAEA